MSSERPTNKAHTPKKNGKVRVAALGDLHLQESAPRSYREIWARVSDEADVLILCGDLTNVGVPREAELLADELRACRVPVVAVLGNHDYERGHADEVKKILHSAGVAFLEDQTFQIGDIGIAGTKGFGGGFDRHVLASFGEAGVKSFVNEAITESLHLENQLRGLSAQRAIVVLHYAPVSGTVQGEPLEIFPFLGCSRLAETIDRYPVSAVFHGHAHHGAFEGKTPKGIPVYNCAAEVLKTRGAMYHLFEL